MAKVLIVDDEESTRLLLARILSEDLRVEVQLAGTCEQALRFARENTYDAIVLDLLMPGVGGRGVLAEIRHGASLNRSTPIVIVSQVTDKETIHGCMAAGASAYHTKPVQRAALVKTLKAHLPHG
jgi:CheY-like chemotaxis protein